MIYKGRVLKVDRDFAVVMTANAEYVKVIRKAGLSLGKQILFMEEDIYEEKKTGILRKYKYAAVFILLLLSAAVYQFAYNIKTPNEIAAVITVDINPSIEMEIDNEEKVIKLTPLNKDGTEILKREFAGKNISEVIVEILINAEACKYLDRQDGMVLISMAVLGDDLKMDLEDIKDEVGQRIAENTKLKNINIMYMYASETAFAGARSHNMSAGRYQLYEELKDQSGDISIESARGMKLMELVSRYRYHERLRNRVEDNPANEEPDKRYNNIRFEERIQERTRTQSREKPEKGGNKGQGAGGAGIPDGIPGNGDGSGGSIHEKQEKQVEQYENRTTDEKNQQNCQENSGETDNGNEPENRQDNNSENKIEEDTTDKEQDEHKEEPHEKPEPGENNPGEGKGIKPGSKSGSSGKKV